MPSRAYHICTAPGCGRLVAGETRRCQAHPYDMREQASRSRESRRGITGSSWRAIRRAVLKREPMCRACRLSEATHVDHIMPRDLDGSSDSSNFQPLCASCHSRKTAREDGGFGNRRVTL